MSRAWSRWGGSPSASSARPAPASAARPWLANGRRRTRITDAVTAWSATRPVGGGCLTSSRFRAGCAADPASANQRDPRRGTGGLHGRRPSGRRTGRSRRPWHGLRVTSSSLPTGGIRDADAGKFAIPSTVADSPDPAPACHRERMMGADQFKTPAFGGLSRQRRPSDICAALDFPRVTARSSGATRVDEPPMQPRHLLPGRAGFTLGLVAGRPAPERGGDAHHRQ
jgi:hypothetical protein